MKTDTYKQHSVIVHEHRMMVPLDHTGETRPGEEIEIFARHLVADGGENKPYLLFLQGGPGGAGPRVSNFLEGWTGEALKDYQVVLMDQRGTGQSTPIDAETVMAQEDPAGFLTLFLQNQILADAEALREEIAGGEQWSTLGQSYGGFLTLGYFSQYPDAIREAFITGGLPHLGAVDDIYRVTYPMTAKRNREYFARYPKDQQTIREVAAHLLEVPEFLPTGERLSPTRLRSVGLDLGGNMAFDQMHYLWEGPFVVRDGQKRLSSQFLTDVGSRVSYQGSPLYWLLQEAIYGSSTAEAAGEATNWSAERVSSEFEGFDLNADPLDTSAPWYMTAEHTFKALIEEDPALAPAMPAVEELSTRAAWPRTYDRDVLAKVDVPVAALVYNDDIYVPRVLSERTAGLLKNPRLWITSRMHHDGLRANGENVFAGLKQLMDD